VSLNSLETAVGKCFLWDVSIISGCSAATDFR